MAEVVTGEAVILDVPVAGFPVRLLALLLDMLIQVVGLVAFIVIATSAGGSLDSAGLAAVVLAGYVLIVVGYPAVFETLSRGKTLGKMALGLRVVSDDGSPERFRQALLRALIGLLEIWTVVGWPVALITSMLSARGKRLGDLAAGTFAIQERAPQRPALPPWLAVVPPPLAGWAQVLELSRLPDETAEAAASYLRRLGDLQPAARDAIGLQLASAVSAQVSPPPPPGTPPAAYLAAVLAVRRDREHARHAAGQPAPAAGPWPGAGYGPGPAPGPIAAPGSPGPANGTPAPPAPGPGGPPWPGPQPGGEQRPDPGAPRPGGFAPPA